MGFRTGAYAKVWDIEPKTENVTVLKLSVSRKDKQTGQWETDFSGFVSVYGQNAPEAGKLKVGDTIRLGDCDVGTTHKNDRYYTNYRLYSYEFVNHQGEYNNQNAGQARPQHRAQAARQQRPRPQNTNRPTPPDELSAEFTDEADETYPF